MKKNLPPESIRIDADTQSRVRTDNDTVDDYAALLADNPDNWPFPPLDVFYDGSEYFLADGFHRLLAALRVKYDVTCLIFKGTAKDARIHGMTANDKNGLRLTRADKRVNIVWLLDNGGKMTQKAVAEAAGVSARTVKRIVAERNPDSIAGKATFTNTGGTGAMSPSESETKIPGVQFDSTEARRGKEATGGDESDPFAEPLDPDDEQYYGEYEDEGPTEPPDPPKPSNGKLEKQFPRSHWFQQWEGIIGGPVRLVDKIAAGVGESGCRSQQTVQNHLNLATAEIWEWMDNDHN